MQNLARLLAIVCAVFAVPSFAQYTPAAGQNTPAAAYMLERDARSGEVKVTKTADPIAQDVHGNAKGNQYDLAVDGAFEGQTVLILDEVGNSLINTRAALKEKGLASVVYPPGNVPSVSELRGALKKSCEVWLISTASPELSDEHIAAIKQFFDAGHGVYIWGDNDPLYVDANRLASALVKGLRMEGNLYGDKVVAISDGERGSPGVRKGHLVTTGLEHLYEGITIATVQFTPKDGNTLALFDGRDGAIGKALTPQGASTRAPQLPDGFTPLLYGSAGNLVSVAYENGGKRLMMDGGFTRLSVSWDDAGTARYVKNAASWLVNAERFGETVATRATPASKR